MLAVEQSVRLDIIKTLLPMASRAGIEDPQRLIEKARTLEEYVLGSQSLAEATPDSAGKRGPGRPRKEKPELPTPDFMTPPNGG